MGRWGFGIYDSDTGLDFLANLLQTVTKEAVYKFSPEQIAQVTQWVEEALDLIEFMIVLTDIDTHGTTDSHILDQATAVERWREAFLRVWDAEWDETHSLSSYALYANRVIHRPFVLTLFDYLHALGEDVVDDEKVLNFKEHLPPIPTRRLGRDGREWMRMGRFGDRFIQHLQQFIFFGLSEENIAHGWGNDLYELDKVWVAIGLLVELCKTYNYPPGFRPETIEIWLNRVMGIWVREHTREGEPAPDIQTLAKEDELYPNVVSVFMDLHYLARQNTSWQSV